MNKYKILGLGMLSLSVQFVLFYCLIVSKAVYLWFLLIGFIIGLPFGIYGGIAVIRTIEEKTIENKQLSVSGSKMKYSRLTLIAVPYLLTIFLVIFITFMVNKTQFPRDVLDILLPYVFIFSGLAVGLLFSAGLMVTIWAFSLGTKRNRNFKSAADK